MAEQDITSQIEYYLDLALKRRWLLIIPFCIAMVVGMYFAVTLPEIYEAKTLILVISQRVPSDYVRSVVSSDIESRISTISQQILSRSNLEKIISQFGLFAEPEYSDMFLEDKVAILRKRIKVEVNNDRRREADAFSISFQGPEPEKVVKVTNGIASSFIEENLKVREAQAVGTSDFLADELETKRKRLEEVEKKLREYRRQYMGELPEQLDANLRILERLQLQINAREESMRDNKARLAGIENQIEADRKILTGSSGVVPEEGGALSLEQLKAQLATLRSNYTDRHPDVIKLKAQIAELENQYKNGQLNSSEEPQANNSGDPTLRLVSNQLNELMRQRVELKGEIQNIEIDVAKLTRQIKEYQERVERTPKHEQELVVLNRDYNNMQESYNSLLNRQLEAEISVNMEKKQKGEQFRVIDHAALPRKPVSPDLRKLFLMAAAAGLGLGAALIFLLDFLNTSIKQPKDYESELGLTILATIPRLIAPRERRWRRVNTGLTVIGLCVAIFLAGTFGLMILKGVDPVLKLVSQYIKI
jgi:polysaccharide chain length determinant protein (PEP-CTERM system associated)